MSEAELYADHVRMVSKAVEAALDVSSRQGAGFDSVVFHAGSLGTYHADDLEVPFRSNAHFFRLAPVPGPDHLVVFRPGKRIVVLRAVANSYWHAAPNALDDGLDESLEIEVSDDIVSSFRAIQGLGTAAFVGGASELANSLGFAPQDIDPPSLVSALDWWRAFKTPYEIHCLREAQRRAGRGHAALREGIGAGMTEFELHLAYLAATGHDDSELPYPNIIAWDEAGAVLHYSHRRRGAPSPGRSFLVDAGARHRGYASDITRTYCMADGPENDDFRMLLDGMESLQKDLAGRVAPVTEFIALHRRAEQLIAELLCSVGIVKSNADDARDRGLVASFFPHGLGHHLGLQVHDVGGRQGDARGLEILPPDDCPHLRTTRRLETGHVVTIEPGLYFIPSLLDALRAGAHRNVIDWPRVEALAPFGGIRIEDDVLVTATGGENLTRPFVPGHREPVETSDADAAIS